MTRYAPLALAAIAILAAAVVNGITTSRWSSGINAKAKACALYLELVPSEIGDWKGVQNNEVDSKVKDVAGIVGEPISRRYVNERTGEAVDVWLIVGHSSQIIRHTPNVCYPSIDFVKMEKQPDNKFTFQIEGLPNTVAWTNLFRKEIDGREALIRVFWMWFEPQAGAPVEWEAPGHYVSDARDEFAGSKALFKLYFTAQAYQKDERADENTAIMNFANEFLPVLSDVLADTGEGKPPAVEDVTAEPTEAEPADAEPTSEDMADAS